jgi:hypothetical protein
MEDVTAEPVPNRRRPRVQHEVWLCHCTFCEAMQHQQREREARLRRRFWEARDLIEDELLSDDDPTVVIEVIDRAPLDNE